MVGDFSQNLAMKRALGLFVALMLVTALRLPAPISRSSGKPNART
jgi:hypothetical protein